MSVDLNVWSNHKLRFNSFKEGFEIFELMTSKKLKPWKVNSVKSLIKTNQIEEVEFFASFGKLEYKFDDWKQLRIRTNFEFCDGITLFKQTLKIHPTGFRTRYSKWKELVTGIFEETDEERLKLMKEYQKNWYLFRAFAQKLTRQLGGDKIIYIDDHSYQLEEEFFNQGESLAYVIKLLKNYVEPCELELFESFPDDFFARDTWHFDDIVKKKKIK